MEAFVSSVQFLAPTASSSTGWRSLRPTQAVLPVVAAPAGIAAAQTSPLGAYAQVAQVACLCGLVAGLASRAHRPGHRRCALGLRVAPVNSQSAPAVASTELDTVENSMAKFVPKISELQSQAALLRNGELRHVIDNMEGLRKPELRGIFTELDRLLGAFVNAIDGLRASAITIRNVELREHFERVGNGWREEQQLPTKSLAETADSSRELETMMEVHVVGLSHHKAPVEVREKLAVPERRWNQYAQELVAFSQTASGYLVPEVAVLSTCNRFELYFASPEMKKYPAIECVHAFLRQKSGLSREELEPFLFTHSGEAAVSHLFEVSSGLDSLVLGEAQILAQVKACHKHSIRKEPSAADGTSAGAGGKVVAKMLNAGIRVGKLVRTRTSIGKGSVSVSSAAVELMAARALPDLRKLASNVRVCILGAGKMSRLLLIALFSKYPDIQLTLVNRSVEKAQALLDEVAARGGSRAKVAPMDAMWEAVEQSDVVFTATASTEPIIRRSNLEGRRRGIMLVDISVPRNVAADCRELDGVHSYSVDDLKKVMEANAEKRRSEVLKAKRLIEDEVGKFKLWQASQGAVPYIVALQAMAERIRQEETEKLSPKLQGLHEKDKEAVNELTRHIIENLLRPIYYSMKDEEEVGHKRSKIRALKSMFRLRPVYKRGLLTHDATSAQLGA